MGDLRIPGGRWRFRPASDTLDSMRPATLARLIRAYAPTWVLRPPSPVRAVVALTRRCNLRCDACRTWSLPPGREMTPDEVARLMRAMPGLAWLDLTGGEPFLRRDVARVFEAVLDTTPSLAVLHFPTSGWFPERTVHCAGLARSRRPEVDLIVTVSLDGPPGLHDALRGRRGSYARAVETWRGLRDIPGVEVRAGTTVGPANLAALDDLRGALHRDLPGFEDRLWHLNVVQVSRHFFANEGLLRVGGSDRSPVLAGPEAEAAIRQGLRGRWPPRSAVDLMETAYLLLARDRELGRDVGLDCHALHSGAFVAADATLYPCHLWDRPLADLRARNFRVAEVWGSPDVLAARGEVVARGCGGCVTACEAYPTLAASPARATWLTVRRLVTRGL